MDTDPSTIRLLKYSNYSPELREILHDVRNGKLLSPATLSIIEAMPTEEKMEIISTMNIVIYVMYSTLSEWWCVVCARVV